MLRAALDAAPSLIAALHLAALESKGALDRRQGCIGGIHDPPTSCSATTRVMQIPLLVDELVRKLAKEFKAACLLVVRMDHLLKKKVGVDTDDAEDSEVETLVPMSGGEIAVHPQLVGADPVVLVNGAGTLVICCDHIQLGDLDNDLVRWRTTRLV